MCLHQIGFIVCPQCHAFDRTINMVMFCDVGLNTRLRVFGREEIPHYFHQGTNPNLSALSEWHFNQAGDHRLPPPTATIAYMNEATICDNCLLKQEGQHTADDNVGVQMRQKNRDAVWPQEITNAPDRRLFDRMVVEAKMGITGRRLGIPEIARGLLRQVLANFFRRCAEKLAKLFRWRAEKTRMQ